MDVKVLEVSEGGRALLTSEHLKVVVDYAFYGIPESGVLFHMAQAPAYGRLDVTVWDRQEDNIFTLLDLNTDQVSRREEPNGMKNTCQKKVHPSVGNFLSPKPNFLSLFLEFFKGGEIPGCARKL